MNDPDGAETCHVRVGIRVVTRAESTRTEGGGPRAARRSAGGPRDRLYDCQCSNCAGRRLQQARVHPERRHTNVARQNASCDFQRLSLELPRGQRDTQAAIRGHRRTTHRASQRSEPQPAREHTRGRCCHLRSRRGTPENPSAPRVERTARGPSGRRPPTVLGTIHAVGPRPKRQHLGPPRRRPWPPSPHSASTGSFGPQFATRPLDSPSGTGINWSRSRHGVARLGRWAGLTSRAGT